jgi:hypothetical protein
MDRPILQAVPAAAETTVTPICHPPAPLPDVPHRWCPSGIPCITQYTPSGTYFDIVKVQKIQHRINLGRNLKQPSVNSGIGKPP